MPDGYWLHACQAARLWERQGGRECQRGDRQISIPLSAHVCVDGFIPLLCHPSQESVRAEVWWTPWVRFKAVTVKKSVQEVHQINSLSRIYIVVNGDFLGFLGCLLDRTNHLTCEHLVFCALKNSVDCICNRRTKDSLSVSERACVCVRGQDVSALIS